VDDRQTGLTIRALRIRRRWRQQDLAERVGVSRWVIARIERGNLDAISIARLRRTVRALDAHLALILRWNGGDLGRLVSGRHAAMHEAVARMFDALDGWLTVPEVSFSYYGERGVIDVIAWHPIRRTLIVIELKTEIVDVSELIGTMDRRERLAWRIARDRGWRPASVSVWVLVADSRTNRRRLAAFATVLRGAFPADGREMRAWLRSPDQKIAALSFLPKVHQANLKLSPAGRVRVRRPRAASAERGSGSRPREAQAWDA
jgi:transcriptional regulator with XRE-family HTH domain